MAGAACRYLEHPALKAAMGTGLMATKVCKKRLHEYPDHLSFCPDCKRVSNNAARKRYFGARKEDLLRKGREYRRANKEITDAQNRRSSLMFKFGITVEQYDSMFVAQSGSCAICKSPQSSLIRALAVDHCHSTGKIRGLLCGECNTGLGKFKDSPDFLRFAAAYLESNKYVSDSLRIRGKSFDTVS